MIQPLRIFAFYLHSQFFGIIFPVTGLRTGLVFTVIRLALVAGSHCIYMLFFVPAFVFQMYRSARTSFLNLLNRPYTRRLFIYAARHLIHKRSAKQDSALLLNLLFPISYRQSGCVFLHSLIGFDFLLIGNFFDRYKQYRYHEYGQGSSCKHSSEYGPADCFT
jgi:hypothetical protein